MTTITDTSITAQHARIISALRESPKTTLQITHDCNCFRSSSRICELRQKGYDIHTRLIEQPDHLGRPHKRIALYSLHGEPRIDEVAA